VTLIESPKIYYDPTMLDYAIYMNINGTFSKDKATPILPKTMS